MNKNNEKIIPNLFKAEKGTKEYEELRAKVSENDSTEISQLSDELDKMLDVSPSFDADVRFKEMIDNEKGDNYTAKTVSIFKNRYVFHYAASILLFIFGWLGGSFVGFNSGSKQDLVEVREQIGDLKKMTILNLINQPAAGDRIKAIQMVSDVGLTDESIQDVMFNVLNYDNNINVRLVALKVLESDYNKHEIQKNLLKSISHQTSPILQMSMLDMVENKQEKAAIPFLNDLLEKRDLDYTVRDRLQSTINTLL